MPQNVPVLRERMRVLAAAWPLPERFLVSLAGPAPSQFSAEDLCALQLHIHQFLQALHVPAACRDALLAHAEKTAAFSDALAEAACPHLRGQAFAAGLCHDIGKALLLHEHADEAHSAAAATAYDPLHGAAAREWERLRFGAEHALAGKWAAEAWRLPEAVVWGIWLHHQPHAVPEPAAARMTLAHLVHVADAAAQAVNVEAADWLTPAIEKSLRVLDLAPRHAVRLLAAARALPALSRTAPPAVASADDGRWLEAFQNLHRVQRVFFSAPGGAAIVRHLAEALRDLTPTLAGCCAIRLEGEVWTGWRWHEDETIEHVFLEPAANAENQHPVQRLLDMVGVTNGREHAAPGLLALPITWEQVNYGQAVLATASVPERMLRELLDAHVEAAGQALWLQHRLDMLYDMAQAVVASPPQSFLSQQPRTEQPAPAPPPVPPVSSAHPLRNALQAAVDEARAAGVAVVLDAGGALPTLRAPAGPLQRTLARLLRSAGGRGGAASLQVQHLPEDARVVLYVRGERQEAPEAATLEELRLGARAFGGTLAMSQNRSGVEYALSVATSPGAPGPQAETRSACTVLIAERDAALRDVLSEAIAAQGLKTRTAGDALETIAAVMGFEVAVVLLDLGMPGVEGGDLLRQIQERGAKLPVVGLSARSATAEPNQDLACLLQKPFEIQRLLNEISALYKRRSEVA